MHQGELTYALKERIGLPELFVGRKEELTFFQSWVESIPKELSRSTALLSRRKKGKTALVERLYNIVYSQNDEEQGEGVDETGDHREAWSRLHR